MFFWNKFCGLALIFLGSGIASCAQTTRLPGLHAKTFLSASPSLHPDSAGFRPEFPPDRYLRPPSSPVTADFATCHYGFFCRQELKLEKATGLPIRIRVGSLRQCNYYEGKP